MREFLRSRGIELPEGDPDDDADQDTVWGVGNRKNVEFQRTLREDGVTVFEGSRRYLVAARDAGLGIAVVSSSANTADVLEVTGLAQYVQHRVDGVTLREEGIKGKPAPDSFLRAAELLGVLPAVAAVFEDAISGVQAGRAGDFGCVVGVNRADHAEALRHNGADVVVDDLGELISERERADRHSRRSRRGTSRDRGETFPVEPWQLRETQLDLKLLAESESLFALSNGHIGLRGNLDEGEPYGLPGTYLGSFYETRPLPYAEAGFGYPEDGQSVVDVTNGKIIRLLVDDEPLDVRYGELIEHERVLDLRAGTLRRTLRWRSPAGRLVDVESTRLVSFDHRSVAAVEYVVRAVDETTRVTVQSGLVANEDQPPQSKDPRVAAAMAEVLEAVHHEHSERGAVLVHRTRRSDLMMAAGMAHTVEASGRVSVETDSGDDWARTTVTTELQPGQKLRLVKYLAYGWSSLRSRPALRDQVAAALTSARYTGWDGLLEDQRTYLEAFWDGADVEVEGDPDVQQAVRFALFHVLQASARTERRAIAGKGLTGPGYDGHAFWDTETFVLPVLTYTLPHAAADALRWRASTLNLAKERAAQLDLQGASFPWRTIRGQECSAYWPAGTAAWHVNADVAAAFERYRLVTGDHDLEAECGLRVLVETARLWISLGHHDRHGIWHIDGVTGPDEYTAVVRDNVFTNLMAAHNLRLRRSGVRAPAGPGRRPGRRPRGDGPVARRRERGARAVRRGARGARAVGGLHHVAGVGLPPQHAVPAAAQRALRAAVPRAGDQAGRPGARDADAGPPVHPGAEGAQRRLLRAPHGARLVAVGLHAGGDVRGGRSPAARARLRLRGRDGRPARPAPQHQGRPAHGVVGRARGRRWCRASVACATTRASWPSTRRCRAASPGCASGCAGGRCG